MAVFDPGTPLGRYSLVQRIGRGGMAEVWSARLRGPAEFERRVVVKRILPHLAALPTFRRLFAAEAQILARMHHPGIVQVFEFAEADDECFLVMEYIPGLNLSALLERSSAEGPLPVAMATHIVHEVAAALAYAHDLVDAQGAPLGIVHRDVSPSNIMIAASGHIKLLDFGVAKMATAADEQTRTDFLRGKVGYLAPETVERGDDIDRRADIFAVGVVLHELLVGRRLFKADTDFGTLELVRACQVAPPSRMRPEVGVALDDICARCLARDRARRYPSAHLLAADLAALGRESKWTATATTQMLVANGIAGASDELPACEPTVRQLAAAALPTRRRRSQVAVVAATLALTTLAVVTHRWWARRPAPAAGATDAPPRALAASRSATVLETPVVVATPSATAPSVRPILPSSRSHRLHTEEHRHTKGGRLVDIEGGDITREF